MAKKIKDKKKELKKAYKLAQKAADILWEIESPLASLFQASVANIGERIDEDE